LDALRRVKHNDSFLKAVKHLPVGVQLNLFCLLAHDLAKVLGVDERERYNGDPCVYSNCSNSNNVRPVNFVKLKCVGDQHDVTAKDV